MLLIKAFGFILALGVIGTSVAMAVMGGRWQKIEQSAYGGGRLPPWFLLGSALVIALYLAALIAFIRSPGKTWAGWILALLPLVGWSIKAILVVFNPKGREAVSSISGDQAWRKVAIARLPLGLLLLVLVYFA
jgi:hypothetical protein